MEEAIYDTLFALSNIMHWFGRYREANILVMTGRLLRVRNLHTMKDLDDLVVREETLASVAEDARPSPREEPK